MLKLSLIRMGFEIKSWENALKSKVRSLITKSMITAFERRSVASKTGELLSR